MISIIKKYQHFESIAGIAVGLSALVVGAFTASWLAGALGLSAAAASQIVAAIEVGGWALTVVGLLFGAGLVGGVIATIRALVIKRGRSAAIA